VKVRLWIRAGGVALTAIAAVTVLSACGGSSTKTAAAANATPGGQQTLQAYVSCLNQNGVKIAVPSRAPGAFPSRGVRPSGGVRPSRSPGAGGFGGGNFGGGGGFGAGGFGGGNLFGDANNPPAGVDATTWKNALAACKSVQPSFARGGTGGAGGAGGFGGGSTAFQAYRNCLMSHGVSASTGTNQLNTADPTIAAAMKTCAPLLPTGRPTTAPSPTS
jgi:hypothetical protein